MADLRIGSQIPGAGALGGPVKKAEAASDGSGNAFAKVMDEALGKVNQAHNEAEQAVTQLTAGGGDITETMLALEKADMSFQVMLEVRNKLINAYDEVMRMQV